ncbi:Cyclic nucleotide-gated cation channel beta-1, partial [Ophiophagus hannah]
MGAAGKGGSLCLPVLQEGLAEGRGSVYLFSKVPEGRTRSNRWKLIKERSNLELRRNFLTGRTINPWNCLPPEVVGASSLEVFKKRLNSPLPEMEEEDLGGLIQEGREGRREGRKERKENKEGRKEGRGNHGRMEGRKREGGMEERKEGRKGKTKDGRKEEGRKDGRKEGENKEGSMEERKEGRKEGRQEGGKERESSRKSFVRDGIRTPTLGQGVGLQDLLRSLPAPEFYGFYKLLLDSSSHQCCGWSRKG